MRRQGARAGASSLISPRHGPTWPPSAWIGASPRCAGSRPSARPCPARATSPGSASPSRSAPPSCSCRWCGRRPSRRPRAAPCASPPLPPIAAARRSSCWPPAAWPSAAATTSTTPRSWPRRPLPRTSGSTNACAPPGSCAATARWSAPRCVCWPRAPTRCPCSSSGAPCSAASTGCPRPPPPSAGVAPRPRRRDARSAAERSAQRAWEDPGRCSGPRYSVSTSDWARATRAWCWPSPSCWRSSSSAAACCCSTSTSTSRCARSGASPWCRPSSCRSRSGPRCGWATGSCAPRAAGRAGRARPRPRPPPGGLVRPADRWLRGERTPETALAAWTALAGLPVDLLRFGRGIPVALNTIPISIFVTLELDGTLMSFLAITAGALVVLAYGVFLRFFVTELAMRPVLADISCALPDGADLGKRSVPLRAKLLVALPVINVVTGVVVAGLASEDPSLRALGVGVVVALIVAFTLSFELSALLARSVVEPIQDLREGTERVIAGDLGARVPVLGTDETGSLAESFNQMVAGLEERERLREAFGAFVDPHLAERVLEEGTAIEGEEVEVTVLFVDIREFTAFAERASAAEVVAELNRFYELVVPVLMRHGGHANKFIGDGLLAVFGAPDELPDHADRGVSAALEIAEVIEEAYEGELRVGIGINSGAVVAGTIGGGGRVEFTVIGDTVNTAARVEEATRETGDAALVTEATCQLLRDDHGGFVERRDVPLKGKAERVRLYAPAVLQHLAEGAAGDTIRASRRR